MPPGTGPLSPLPCSRPPTLIPDYVTGKVSWSRVIPTFTAPPRPWSLGCSLRLPQGAPPLQAQCGYSSWARGP